MTERLDIEITDKGGQKAAQSIKNIATASLNADKGIEKLNKSLKALDSNAVSKLAKASADLALANQRNAQASAIARKEADAHSESVKRLILLNNKLSDSNSKLMISLDKSAISSEKVKQATSRSNILKQQAIKLSNVNAGASIREASAKQTLINKQLSEQKSTVALNIAKSRSVTETYKQEAAYQRLVAQTNRVAASHRDAAQSTANFVRTYATLLTAGYSTTRGISYVDSYTLLQNKLRQITDSSQQLAVATERIFEVANKTYAPVAETASAFQRFDRALIQLGASQEESLRLTETVNKAMIISGANTGEMSAGLLQLSQAFNKGKLDGDEFRTVMELMPEIAQAIADKMDVARGKLLDLAPQGEITGEIMRAAFADAADVIDKKFSQIIPTVSQAWQKLNNNLKQYLGGANNAYGATQQLAQAIEKVANNVDVLIEAGKILFIVFAASKIKALIASLTLISLNPVVVGITAVAVALDALVKNQERLAARTGGVDYMGSTDELLKMMRLMAEYKRVLDDSGKSAWQLMVINPKLKNSTFDNFRDLQEAITMQGGTGFTNSLFKVDPNKKSRFENVLRDLAVQYDRLLNPNTGSSKLRGERTELNMASIEKDLKAIEKIENKFGKARLNFERQVEKLSSGIRKTGVEERTGLLEVQRDKLLVELKAEYGNTKKYKELEYKVRQSYAEKIIEEELKDVEKRAKIQQKKQDYIDTLITKLKVENEAVVELGAEQAARNRIDEINIKLGKKKIEVSQGERNEIDALVLSIEKQKVTKEELANIYSETTGKSEQLIAKLVALRYVYDAGLLSQDFFTKSIVEMGTEAAYLNDIMGNATWADSLLIAMGRVTDGYTTMFAGISESFGDFNKSLLDGFADSFGRAIVYGEDLGDSLKDVAKSAVAELISSLIKLSMQQIITSVIGQVIQKKAMVSSVAMAKTLEAAWMKPALLSSIATGGASVGTGSAALSAAIAVSKAVSLGSTILDGADDFGSASEGGYFPGDRDKVRGVFHGDEFVMNAKATSQNLPMLEAMNKGISPKSVASATSVNVKVENYGSSKISVQKSGNDIRIIAREEASKVIQSQTPGLVASEINNPNSRISRSLSTNLQSNRRR